MSATDHLPSDFTGRLIEVGDNVIYPVRRGSSMWLKRMRVTSIEDRGEAFVLGGFDPDSPTMRRITVTTLERCVVEVPNG